MIVFLDSRFTSFHEGKLISVGAVSEDDQRFYEVSSSFLESECSPSTLKTVLPYLGKPGIPEDELLTRLSEWLGTFDELVIVTSSSLALNPITTLILDGRLKGNVRMETMFIPLPSKELQKTKSFLENRAHKNALERAIDLMEADALKFKNTGFLE